MAATTIRLASTSAPRRTARLITCRCCSQVVLPGCESSNPEENCPVCGQMVDNPHSPEWIATAKRHAQPLTAA